MAGFMLLGLLVSFLGCSVMTQIEEGYLDWRTATAFIALSLAAYIIAPRMTRR